MKLSSLVKKTGLCVAITFAGQANASLVGSFSGTMSSITPWANTVNGNLGADIAADANSPFDLGTLFAGTFSLNEAALDSNPGSTVGMYNAGVESFSIAGGDINNSSNSGYVRIADNEVVGSNVRDNFQLGAMGINQIFVINGNNWIFNTAHIILDHLDPAPSSIFNDDGIDQPIASSTPWKWEQVMLKFTLQGVQNSEHYARLGGNDLSVEVLASSSQPASVPVPATLPLMAAALGMFGLRRRRR
jgi:hypothetical protein